MILFIMKGEIMVKNKNSMMRTFVIFSIALFSVILIGGGSAYFFSMRQIIRTNKTNEFLPMLEIKRMKLEAYVRNEIAIAVRMARSKHIKDYFSHPTDENLRKNAFTEIAAYRAAFDNNLVFWVNDIDRKFYTNDNEPYVVDPALPVNYWYNMTLYETDEYNFNINYNPDIKMINLWINAPVFDNDKKPIGMVGAGLELSKFVDVLFSDVNERAELYYFNADGEITGARNIVFVSSKSKIDEAIDGVKWSVADAAKSLAPNETRTLDVQNGILVIGTIPQLKWYSAVFMPDSIADYKTTVTALFLIVLAVILLIIIVFNAVVYFFLKSQQEAMVFLERARNEAEAANKSKSNFLATMSHEIRTPMNAIIGIAQIQLQQEKLPDGCATAFEKIYGSAQSQLGIINDILDMSKIETGKMELNPVEYDTPSLINDAVQLNVVRIGSKTIKFIVDVDENMPSRLYGDELRIKQILNNLLSNAIKYTVEGHVKLSVGCVSDSDGVTLRISVEDTGQGMKPEDMERLFLEYRRFNAEANRATEGTGIGLSITKKLAEMMDGAVGVESEYGKGSVFTVTVRQKAVECPPIGAGIAEKLREFAFTGGRQSADFQIVRERMPYGSVLVVDDVGTNLYVAEGLLAPYQLKVGTADSGFEAVEKAESGNVYDIIFMDHMMPRMDGIETTRKLREMGYKGPIVALTANAIVGNDEMFMRNGFDGFISKPIDVRHLNDILNKLVRDRHPEEAKKHTADAVTTVTSEPSGSVNHSGTNQIIRKIFINDAEKAVVTLRETVQSGDAKLFTITAHAMKSALANVGENDASKAAAALENAGRSGDTGYISANIDGFVKTLESLIGKFKSMDNNGAVGGSNIGNDKMGTNDSIVDEDTDYLMEQLLIIKSACDNYDDDTAYAALDRLKEKRWKTSTAESLEKIRNALFVNSDFEAAGEMCSALTG
ncbi:histidine kinase [Fibrobacteres bacterium R8-0-B4]